MRKGTAREKRWAGYGKDGKASIGLVGTHKGVGTTHTALLLAAFLSSIMGEDVGLVEMNPHRDLEQMEWSLLGEMKHDEGFEYRKIHFYKGVREKDVPAILGEGRSCLIMDFGSTLEQNWREFVRCDEKLVICSHAEWKSMELNRFLQRYQSLYGIHSWKYLIPFGNERMKKWLKKEWNIHTEIITYEPNPFTPSEKSILLFRNIING